MLDQELFLQENNLKRAFEKSEIPWETLAKIYMDYSDNVYSQMQSLAGQLVSDLETEKKNRRKEKRVEGKLVEESDIHVIYGRAKEPEHVIEKIIRKVGIEDSQKYRDINVENYRDKMTDLIGIRIIVVKKEGWKEAHDLIGAMFPNFGAERPMAYVCYGDREVIEESDNMRVDYTVKGYRSQHYIVWYESSYAEIQVRTMAEEVYGEFDHRVRYPYFQDNKFLIRYTNMISKNIAELDDMISTCMQIDKKLLEQLNQQFKDDKYTDWSKKQHSDEFFIVENQKKADTGSSVEEIWNNKLFG